MSHLKKSIVSKLTEDMLDVINALAEDATSEIVRQEMRQCIEDADNDRDRDAAKVVLEMYTSPMHQ